jgi:hypothetical protein
MNDETKVLVETLNKQITEVNSNMEKLYNDIHNNYAEVRSRIEKLEVGMKVPTEAIAKLIEINGREAIRDAFKTVVGVATIKPQLGYDDILKPNAIIDLHNKEIALLQELDYIEGKYNVTNKKAAVKLFKECETSVKIAEAEAVMSPQFASLRNDRERDAYRRTYAVAERTALASAEVGLEQATADVAAVLEEKLTVMKKLNALEFTKQLIASIFKYIA